MQWRLGLLILVGLAGLAGLVTCWLGGSGRAPEPSTGARPAAGAGRETADAARVRPPSHEDLWQRYALSEADSADGSGRADEAQQAPPGWETRYRYTAVDPVGPSVPDGEARFTFVVTDVIGPRPYVEVLAAGHARPSGRGNADAGAEAGAGAGADPYADADAGEDADEDADFEAAVEADAEILVVTLRGRVRNRTGQDCVRLVLKASYLGADGFVQATGRAVVYDVPANGGRDVSFEVHVPNWPDPHTAPPAEAFHLHEVQSHWHP